MDIIRLFTDAIRERMVQYKKDRITIVPGGESGKQKLYNCCFKRDTACLVVWFGAVSLFMCYNDLKITYVKAEGATMNKEITFRYATENDTAKILHFIKELAIYENMLDQVVATEEILKEWVLSTQL